MQLRPRVPVCIHKTEQFIASGVTAIYIYVDLLLSDIRTEQEAVHLFVLAMCLSKHYYVYRTIIWIRVQPICCHDPLPICVLNERNCSFPNISGGVTVGYLKCCQYKGYPQDSYRLEHFYNLLSIAARSAATFRKRHKNKRCFRYRPSPDSFRCR